MSEITPETLDQWRQERVEREEPSASVRAAMWAGPQQYGQGGSVYGSDPKTSAADARAMLYAAVEAATGTPAMKVAMLAAMGLPATPGDEQG